MTLRVNILLPFVMSLASVASGRVGWLASAGALKACKLGALTYVHRRIPLDSRVDFSITSKRSIFQARLGM